MVANKEQILTLSVRFRNQNLKFLFSSVKKSSESTVGFRLDRAYTILTGLSLDSETDASASGEAGARGVPASIFSIVSSLSFSIALFSICILLGEEIDSRSEGAASFGEVVLRGAFSLLSPSDIGDSFGEELLSVSSNEMESQCLSRCVLLFAGRGEV